MDIGQPAAAPPAPPAPPPVRRPALRPGRAAAGLAAKGQLLQSPIAGRGPNGEGGLACLAGLVLTAALAAGPSRRAPRGRGAGRRGAAGSGRLAAARGAPEGVPSQEFDQPEVNGKRQVAHRRQHLVKKKQPEQPYPDNINPYAPGEGYASNSIPFSGYAPKRMYGRYSESAANEVRAMIENAADKSRRMAIEAARRREGAMERVPVPEDLAAELEERGWLAAVRERGCQVSFDDDRGADMLGARWRHLVVSGPEKAVRASTLLLMAALAPPMVALDAD